MKKSQLKSLIREAVSTRLSKSTIKEGVMSDIDIIAQESATFDEFVNSIRTDPDYKSVNVNDPEVKVFLQQIYDDTQEINEINGFTSGKQFIDIKLQKYPKAIARIDELVTMIGESRFTIEMAEWLFDFFNNASYERPIAEQVRKLPINTKLTSLLKELLADNYPSFKTTKTIGSEDKLVSVGTWTFTGRESGGKGIYMNTNNRQTYAFDLTELQALVKSNPADIEIMSVKQLSELYSRL